MISPQKRSDNYVTKVSPKAQVVTYCSIQVCQISSAHPACTQCLCELYLSIEQRRQET